MPANKKKLSNMTPATTLAADTIFEVSQDPSGTPRSEAAALSLLKTWLESQGLGGGGGAQIKTIQSEYFNDTGSAVPVTDLSVDLQGGEEYLLEWGLPCEGFFGVGIELSVQYTGTLPTGVSSSFEVADDGTNIYNSSALFPYLAVSVNPTYIPKKMTGFVVFTPETSGTLTLEAVRSGGFGYVRLYAGGFIRVTKV